MDATIHRLHEHRAEQLAETAAWTTAWQDTGYVFTREDGTPLKPEHLLRRFQRLSRDAGLPVIRFHDLRHTNATLALEAGVDIKVVSERLGHSTTVITSNLYTHVNPKVGRAAADKIGSLLNSAVHTPTQMSTQCPPRPCLAHA